MHGRRGLWVINGAQKKKKAEETTHMSSSSGGVVPGDVTAPNPLHNTSKYKVYVQAVDRALKTFENPNEWADLISALAKLTKVCIYLYFCY
ncbi:unnamed protein product [Strongylus vulgaris]|uniref:DOP1 N-terminal domain-containing protein n=1 Tax=Strongylus vulgaris TaxID=40348 RepID=A0A3P7IAL1_STRVU|nr:unnamed protein product [Strongylus vulgaris]